MVTERQFWRRVAAIFAALYLAVAVSFAAMKAGTSYFGSLPWPEVVYGPAILIGCCFLLFYAAARVESWVRGRASP